MTHFRESPSFWVTQSLLSLLQEIMVKRISSCECDHGSVTIHPIIQCMYVLNTHLQRTGTPFHFHFHSIALVLK